MIDHSQCAHEQTKAARARCRRAAAGEISHKINRAYTAPLNKCDRCGAVDQEPCLTRAGKIAPQIHVERRLLESVSNEPESLSERLTRGSTVAGVWVVLRDAQHVRRGYVVSSVADVLWLRLGDNRVRLSWQDDDFELFLDK